MSKILYTCKNCGASFYPQPKKICGSCGAKDFKVTVAPSDVQKVIQFEDYIYKSETYLCYVWAHIQEEGVPPVFGVPVRKCLKCRVGSLRFRMVCSCGSMDFEKIPCPLLDKVIPFSKYIELTVK